MGTWLSQHQTYIASIITLLVSSAWTPLIRKLPHNQLFWVIIRAILAGVPKEIQLAPRVKKEEKVDEITNPVPPIPPTAA